MPGRLGAQVSIIARQSQSALFEVWGKMEETSDDATAATWKVHWHIAMPSGGASILTNLPPIRIPAASSVVTIFFAESASRSITRPARLHPRITLVSVHKRQPIDLIE